MAASKPVTIIGGGLAGLTLGIGLRRRGVPVAVAESGRYPRHRVCGEFISGRGQQALERLGLRPLIASAGAVTARTAAFFSTTRGSGARPLPAAALCLSRFRLDALLAEQFRSLGGALFESQPRAKEDMGEGIVRATGRRAQPAENACRWFGLKTHVRNLRLIAGLELHLSPRGYVGLCRVESGLVNVCGLFRRRAEDQEQPSNPRQLLLGPKDSWLRRRLAGARFETESFCAVAGISLQPYQAAGRPGCCVGDAITMIPPFTGNGMSMAVESAELAIEPLVAWSQGEVSWGQTRREIARRCDTAFARRLVWAKWLNRIILLPVLQLPLVAVAGRNDCFFRMAFGLTR